MKILVRIVDDWMEIYVNGSFIMDMDADYFDSFFSEFLLKFSDTLGAEVRIYKLQYVDILTGIPNFLDNCAEDPMDVSNYNPPLYAIQGHYYWDDWEDALPIREFREVQNG